MTETKKRMVFQKPVIPTWWQHVYPNAHAALKKLEAQHGARWPSILDITWKSEDPEIVPKDILELKRRLGTRCLSPTIRLAPGDGVSVVTHGSRMPATVRSVTSAGVVVSTDYYVKRGERVLFLPSRKDDGILFFTPRSDGTLRLQNTRTSILIYGRSYL